MPYNFEPLTDYIKLNSDVLGPLLELKKITGTIRWHKFVGRPRIWDLFDAFTILHTVESEIVTPPPPPKVGFTRSPYTRFSEIVTAKSDKQDPAKLPVQGGPDEYIVEFECFPRARAGEKNDPREVDRIVVDLSRSVSWDSTMFRIVFPFEIDLAPTAAEFKADFFVMPAPITKL